MPRDKAKKNSSETSSSALSSLELEEGESLLLPFQNKGRDSYTETTLIPVVVQNYETKEVLFVASTNREAFMLSLEKRLATFYSKSRKELWLKGNTSGDFLEIISVRVNCEQNSLLYLVNPKTGSACHTKDKEGKSRKNCYYREIKNGKLNFL